MMNRLKKIIGAVIIYFIFIFILEFIADRILLTPPERFFQNYEQTLTETKSELRYLPNPLYGYYLNSKFANNYGFITPYSYPYQATDNECTLAILGGSLASNFAIFLNKSAAFKTKYERKICPGKKLIVLNMAADAMKQPQQFIIGTNFISSIDYAINIEGFNEIDAGFPTFPVEYPMITDQLYDLTVQQKELRNKIMLKNRQIKKISHFMHQTPSVSQFSIVYLIWKKIVTSYQQENLRSAEEFRQKTSWGGRFQTGKKTYSQNEILQIKIDNWMKYVQLQKIIFDHYMKPNLFFLQPNQYVKNSKKSFFEKERDHEVYKQNIPHSYEYLRKSVRQLQKKGILIYDLTMIFQNETQLIYRDNCCHVNKNGNAILAIEILKKIAMRKK